MNKALKTILLLAEELIEKQKIKSRRAFSKIYLNKSDNYLGALVYKNGSPSVAAFLSLYERIQEEKDLSRWKEILEKTIKGLIYKEAK